MNKAVALLIALPLLVYGIFASERALIPSVLYSQAKVVKIGLSFVGSDKKAHRFIGSGALISADGSILTCAHLFGRDGRVYVKTVSGQTYLAHIVRIDHTVDLAVIKIDPPRPLPYFRLGRQPRIGQKVYAYGSPLDIQGCVSQGNVVNVDEFTIHSAAINPGNSGGPLVDEDGLLVGVNVAVPVVNIFQMAQGMGLAVSMADINRFVRL